MRFDWSVGPAEVHTYNNLSDVVTHVMWYCTAYAPDGTTYKRSGSVQLGNPDPNRFVPFKAITADQVNTWVFSLVDKTKVENELTSEYANSANSGPIKPFNF